MCILNGNKRSKKKRLEFTIRNNIVTIDDTYLTNQSKKTFPGLYFDN